MPFVISHPHSSSSSSGPSTAPTDGRIRKHDRRRSHSLAAGASHHQHPKTRHLPNPTHQQRKQQHQHQLQKPRRKQNRPRSSTFSYHQPSQRASSLGDIISGIVQHQFQVYIQKRSSGTKSSLPTRSATALQLSKLQQAPTTTSATTSSTSRRISTVSSSASFSFGFSNQQHRLSSVSAASSIGVGVRVRTTSTTIIPSGISNPVAAEQAVAAAAPSAFLLQHKHAIAETDSVLETEPTLRIARTTSPRFPPHDDEVIDQQDIVMPISASGGGGGPGASSTAAATAARVAFGLLDSPSRTSSAVSRTYLNMAETSTPSIFLTGLSSQCVHTIYAGSFVVYATNLAADWLHTYYACKGWSVTFPLKPWLTILMICCCAAGGVCNFLLLYLCVENALRRKWEGDPFQGGCRFICQRLCNWLTDFDCFRISFLIFVFENAPMTFVNYWFISSCSIPRPGKVGWTFAFACGATTLSILWRGVMTALAYKNLRCLRRPHWSSGRGGSKRSTASATAYFPLPQQGPGPAGAMTIGEIQHQKLEAKISGSSSVSTMDELRSKLGSRNLVLPD